MDSNSRYVVADSLPELRYLRAWVENPNMPSVDLTMLFETLYDTIEQAGFFYHHALYGLAAQMAYGDYLYENNCLSVGEKEELMRALISAGHAIALQVARYKFHTFRQLHYRFREYKNDALIFEAIPTQRQLGDWRT